MEAFHKALEAQRQAEDLRKLAVEGLLKQRAEIDRQLSELGHKREYKKLKKDTGVSSPRLPREVKPSADLKS